MIETGTNECRQPKSRANECEQSQTDVDESNQAQGLISVWHGYGKTRGFEVTGLAGTGTVSDLAYPRITVYPCHGITGMYGYITG